MKLINTWRRIVRRVVTIIAPLFDGLLEVKHEKSELTRSILPIVVVDIPARLNVNTVTLPDIAPGLTTDLESTTAVLVPTIGADFI